MKEHGLGAVPGKDSSSSILEVPAHGGTGHPGQLQGGKERERERERGRGRGRGDGHR